MTVGELQKSLEGVHEDVEVFGYDDYGDMHRIDVAYSHKKTDQSIEGLKFDIFVVSIDEDVVNGEIIEQGEEEKDGPDQNNS